jgi:hypothetical protein
VTVTVAPLDQAGVTPQTAVAAARASARSQFQRLLRVDQHHAAVVDRASGRVVEVYVDARGPFPVVFLAKTRPRARLAAALLRSLAHGSRFDWGGPDVVHLASDPAAVLLVRDANAVAAATDAYRVSVSLEGRLQATMDTVRSQQFRSIAAPPFGVMAGSHDLFFGTDSYHQHDGDDCWQHSVIPENADSYGAAALPEPGALTAYLPPRPDGANLDVELQQWGTDALRTTVDLAFDQATHELRTVVENGEVFQYDWHAQITVPARPAPVC